MAEKPTDSIRFIHTADVHLGRPFEGLGPRAEDRRADLRAAFRRIVDHAVREGVDLFLVAGDLFDSPLPPPADREAAGAAFRRLKEAGVRSFAIPGNHDYYIPGGVWSEMEAAGVVVFARPALERRPLPDLGVCVWGMAYDRDRPHARPLAGLAADGLDGEGAGLFLFHGSLDVIGEGYEEAPFSEAEIARLPFAYVALGHYHGHRAFGTRPRAAYPGSPQGLTLSASETGERFALLGRLEGDREKAAVRLEKVAAGGRTVHIRELDLSRFAAPEGLFETVRGAAPAEDLLSLRLSGAADAEVWRAAEQLEERFADAFFHFDVDRRRVTLLGALPDDDRFILGRFAGKLQAKIRGAEGEDRVVFETALRLGLAAARRSSAPLS